MSVGGVDSMWVAEGRQSGGGSSSWTTNDSARLDSTSSSIIAPTVSSSPPIGLSSANGEDTSGPITWIEQPQQQPSPQSAPPAAECERVATVTVNIEGVVVLSGGGRAEQSENAAVSARSDQVCGESGDGEATAHSSIHLVVDRPPSYPDTKEWAANSEYTESSRADEEEEEDVLTPHSGHHRDHHQRLAAADSSIDPALATIVAAAVKVSKEAYEGRLEQQHQDRETDESASPQKKSETDIPAPLHEGGNGSGSTMFGSIDIKIEIPTVVGQESGKEVFHNMVDKAPNGALSTSVYSVNNAPSQNLPVKTESKAAGSAESIKTEDTHRHTDTSGPGPTQTACAPAQVGGADTEISVVGSERTPESQVTINFTPSLLLSRPEAAAVELGRADGSSLKPVEQNPLSDASSRQAAQSAEIHAETDNSPPNPTPTQLGSVAAGLEGGASTADGVAGHTAGASVESAHTGLAEPSLTSSSLFTAHVPPAAEETAIQFSIEKPAEDAVMTIASNSDSIQPLYPDVNSAKTVPSDSSSADVINQPTDDSSSATRIPVNRLEVVMSEVPLTTPAETFTTIGVESADSNKAQAESSNPIEIIFVEQPPVLEQQPSLRGQVAESVKTEPVAPISATETIWTESSAKEGATQPTSVNKADVGQAESATPNVSVGQAGEHRILESITLDNTLPTVDLPGSSSTVENSWKPASDEPAVETRPTDYSQIVFIEQPANEQVQLPLTADQTPADTSANVGGLSEPVRKDDEAARTKPLTAINLDALNQSYLESLERQRSANGPRPSNVAEVVRGQVTGSSDGANDGSTAERRVVGSGDEKSINFDSARPHVNEQPDLANCSATAGDVSGGTWTSGNAEPTNSEHRVRFQVPEPTPKTDNYDKLIDEYGQKVWRNTQESLALVDRLSGEVPPTAASLRTNGRPSEVNGRASATIVDGAGLDEKSEIPYFSPPPLKQPPPVDALNLLTINPSTDESIDVECISVNANLLNDPIDCVMMSNGRVAILDAELGLMVVSVADRSVVRSADAPRSATIRWRNPICAAYALDTDHLLVLAECCSVEAASAERSQADNSLPAQQSSGSDRPFRHQPPTVADVPTLNQLLEPRDTDYQPYICRFDAQTLRLESRVEAPKFLADKVVNGYRLCYAPSTHAIYLAANAAREGAYVYELNADCRWAELYNRRGRLFTDLQWFAVIGPVTELIVLEANRQHVLLLSVYDGDVVGQRMVAIAAQPNALAVDEAGALFAFDRATARVAQHSRLHFDRIRNVTLMDRAHCRLSAHGGFLAVLMRGVKQLKLYKY